VRGRGEKMMR
jgi:hypothetical protein